jgi:selenide,water dikinase
VRDPEIKFGLAVTGTIHPDRILTNAMAKAGDVLVLTKPLGTGVLFHADMRGLARGPWLEATLHSVARNNAAAMAVARTAGVEAVTDVTGFGLVGHLGEMLRASGVSARIRLAELPALPGAVELLARGLRSTFHPENERARRGIVVAPAAAQDPRLGLLFDPQTSGGLLFGIDEAHAAGVLGELRAVAGAAVIGEVFARRDDGVLIEVA